LPHRENMEDMPASLFRQDHMDREPMLCHLHRLFPPSRLSRSGLMEVTAIHLLRQALTAPLAVFTCRSRCSATACSAQPGAQSLSLLRQRSPLQCSRNLLHCLETFRGPSQSANPTFRQVMAWLQLRSPTQGLPQAAKPTCLLAMVWLRIRPHRDAALCRMEFLPAVPGANTRSATP
jgi:hypothetical protein